MNNITHMKTKVELVDKTPLLKMLAMQYKEALDDCWKYHEKRLKENKPKLKKSELKDYLYNFKLYDFEDVGFFIGYLQGIDNAVELLSEAKPHKEKRS